MEIAQMAEQPAEVNDPYLNPKNLTEDELTWGIKSFRQLIEVSERQLEAHRRELGGLNRELFERREARR